MKRFSALVREWMVAWGQVRAAHSAAPPPPRLEKVVLAPDRIEVTDTRPIAREPRLLLEGHEARVLEACDAAPSPAMLARQMGLAAPELDRALARLRDHRLILDVDNRVLALPTPPPRAPYYDVGDCPAGYVFKETEMGL